MSEKYISDIIDLSKLDKKKFNLVYSFCGTGKTYFVGNHLINYLGDVKPQEMVFITSRSMVVEQQAKINDENICKFNPHNLNIIRGWNGESELSDTLVEDGIQTMTIDKIIYLLHNCGSAGYKSLRKAKVIVIDECHSLFSDIFIKDMIVLQVWIKTLLEYGEQIFIGLTATPNILLDAAQKWGVHINMLNEEPLIRYKIKNLYCADYSELEYLCRDSRFSGKTLIMCYSVRECFELQKYFKNSAVLVSQSNKHYNKEEMDYLRDYIVENETLPDTFITINPKLPLQTVITTSTMREGVNLKEESGIKNIICCIPDELHITQFAGRCRFNIENLIVVNTCIHREKYQNPYLYAKRMEFKEFMKNHEDLRWFNTIKHLLVNPEKPPEILSYGFSNLESCINEQFLNCKVYREGDKNLIVEKAYKDRIFDVPHQAYTFNRVMRYLVDSGKYSIDTVRAYEGKKTYNAKIIIKNNT